MHKRIALSLVLALSVTACEDTLPMAPRRGSISVTPGALSASFVDASEEVVLDESTRSVGDCLVRRWRTDLSGPEARYVSAGTVTASGIDRCSVDGVESYRCEATLFDASVSQTVTVTASGGEVPAFSVEVATPVRPDIQVPVAASASEDLVLRWTGGSGRVFVGGMSSVVIDEVGSTRNVAVLCEADAAAGELTVPASALEALLANEPSETPSGWLSVVAMERETVTAGDYEVEVVVSAPLGTPVIAR